jgi:hypothetical protein
MNPLVDYFETLAINAGIGAMMIAIRNPQTAAALKTKLGTLVEAICAAYGWNVTIT